MAVKKNPKPLTILVDDSIIGTKGFTELARKGHTVVPFSELSEPLSSFDMIIGPKAWRMLEEMAESEPMVEAAVKAARAVKFRRKGAEE